MADDKLGATGKRQRSSSVKSKQETKKGNTDLDKEKDKISQWECKLCNQLFKEEVDEVLECEFCEEHFCRRCLHMSSTEYKLLSKRSDLHWYCPPCEAKAMKNLKLEKDVEERCREYFSKLESRMSNIEKRLDGKPDKTEVQTMIDDSIKSQGNNDKAPDVNIDERLADMRESESRRNNIIIHGLGEPISTDRADVRREDEESIKTLCEILEVDDTQVSDVTRLGKEKDSDNTRPRLIRVSFREGKTKDKAMKSLHKLASAEDKFRKISVAHDMTIREREENKKK